MDKVTTDNRLFERISARFPTRIKSSRQDYGTNVFLQDMSASGVKMSTTERFLIDDRLALEVELPDGLDPLQIKGIVRWTKSLSPKAWEVGIQLSDINLMNVRRLYHFALEADPSLPSV